MGKARNKGIKNLKSPSNVTTQTPDSKEKAKPVSNKSSAGHRKKKGLTLPQLLLFLTGLSSTVSAILYYYYSKYGSNLFFGHARNDWSWSAYQWRSFLLDNSSSSSSVPKSILLLGGPHRGGTTIVWEAVASHPDVAGFGSTFDTGADYSEGVLIQDVYPRFGVGLEFTRKENGGLGQYALLPNAHWTDVNRSDEVTVKNFEKLMNRFAPHWCSGCETESCVDYLGNKKIFLEKSPQNAVLSRFLEALYNIDVNADGSVSEFSKILLPSSSRTKFLFVTRHPLANMLALNKFIAGVMGKTVSYEILMQNYIQLHKYMLEDSKKLASDVIWVKIEDFTSNPKDTLKRIFEQVGLGQNVEATVDNILRKWAEEGKTIFSDPNNKYAHEWCQAGGGFGTHQDLVLKYDEEIVDLGLGYDLKQWCDSQFDNWRTTELVYEL